MITVTAKNLADLADQVDELFRQAPAEKPVTEAKAFVFEGHLDDFSGNVYQISHDGKVSFAVFDPKEPHGSLKVEASPELAKEVRAIGLAPHGKRLRITVEVL